MEETCNTDNRLSDTVQHKQQIYKCKDCTSIREYDNIENDFKS